jgi:hypothetical protein
MFYERAAQRLWVICCVDAIFDFDGRGKARRTLYIDSPRFLSFRHGAIKPFIFAQRDKYFTFFGGKEAQA